MTGSDGWSNADPVVADLLELVEKSRIRNSRGYALMQLAAPHALERDPSLRASYELVLAMIDDGYVDVDWDHVAEATASFQSLSLEELRDVWREASALDMGTSSMDGVLDRLQVDAPSVPSAVLRAVLMSFVWLVAWGLLTTATTDNTDTSKDLIALTGLNPVVIATALAIWTGRATKSWQERDDGDDEV